jgi:branched-chain amino acid transport system substrate-binding protein
MAAGGCALGALAFGIAACGGEEDGGGAAPAGEEAQIDLTVGSLLPLSGDLADQGPAGRKSVDLAVEEINSGIKEAGVDHSIESLQGDSQTNPQAAVQLARDQVGDDATCLTGPWSSGENIPVAQSVSIREEVPNISPSSTADEVSELEDDGFNARTVTPDAIQAVALADLVEQELGGAEGTVVNVGARDDPYGTNLAEKFREQWEERGGEIGEEVIYDPGLQSYDSEAQQLVAGGPDGWVIVDFPETYGKVGPALARTGDFDPAKTFTTDGLTSETLAEDVGDEASDGIRGTVPGAPQGFEATDAFDQLFEQSNIKPPEQVAFDPQQFDAVVVCYLAAVAAGSTEGADIAEQIIPVTGPPGDQYTWEELPQAIEALQNGDDIDYEGASGPIDMDDAGTATTGVYDVYSYENGKFNSQVDEVEVGTLEE